MAHDARSTDQNTDGSAGDLAGMRVAILAEMLYEDLELWYPYYRLREAGVDVFIVGSGSAETYQSKHGYPVTVDAEADTVTASHPIPTRRGVACWRSWPAAPLPAVCDWRRVDGSSTCCRH